MTKTIEIFGIIGWDVWPDMINWELKQAAGEDVEILFNSDGGYISEGIPIFNLIYDYPGKTTAKIIGMAGSMSSYIPLAANKVIAKSNVVMIIHDAITLTYGNEADHNAKADLLGRYSNFLAEIYAKKTGKSLEEIRSLMKAETHFLGREMLDAGLVDEIEEIEFDQNDRDSIIQNAKIRSQGVVNKINQRPENFEKIAALFSGFKAQGRPKIFASATTFKDYPIYEKEWDSAAAVGRWREKSGSTEEPSSSYKNGFFWYDQNAPENFGSYKLPFVDVIDNTVYAIRRGVFAANGAMSGARGGVNIPSDEKPAVQSHIDKYLKKIEKFDEEQQDLSNQRLSANSQNLDGDDKMSDKILTLNDFLAQNIHARIEYDKFLAIAKEDGKKETEAQFKANIERMTPLMQAKECSLALRQAGFDALMGKTDFNTFIALAEYEARQIEAKKSQDADGEVPADTPPTQPANTQSPKNATDMKELVAELKNQI